MNARQEKLVEKIVKQIKKKFPDIIYDGVWDKGDESWGIRLITYTDNGLEISEAFSRKLMKIYDEEGYDIFLMPMEIVDEEGMPIG